MAQNVLQAKRYAQAVFEIAQERKELDRWQSDLRKIAVLAQNTEFVTIIENPRFPFESKAKLLERQLGEHPQFAEELDRQLFEEEILLPLSKAGVVRLEHVKLSGKPVRPREGLLLESSGGRILVKRSFSQFGRYDGLDLPIEPGDYSLVEVREGDWFVKHTYYSKADRLKGEYCNVNSPVELYPYGARYLDLEVDVIRRAGEAPFIVDREELAVLAKDGLIGPGLEKKALEVADGLLKNML